MDAKTPKKRQKHAALLRNTEAVAAPLPLFFYSRPSPA